MDLLHAVAVSMLGVSRLRATRALHALRQSSGAPSIDDVLERLKVPPPQRRTLADAAWQAAEEAIAAAAAGGIEPVAVGDPRYPALLACTTDPPPVLWMRGSIAALTRPSVAVVGSRGATPYALQVARRLSAELAARGIVVVSGLARGVDSAAHEGALAGGGETVAVLGSGVDRIYPAEHDLLADRISAKGLLVSELPPGAPPLPGHFPLRNRIISGISWATVVVEASENSGSLITAACAMRQGRDVMAVPGSVLGGRNRGSHALLKDGAKVVETADDILDELGWVGAIDAPPRRRVLDDDPLLARMEAGEPYALDELVELTGFAATKLLPRLMELELLGKVESVPGGRFVRCA